MKVRGPLRAFGSWLPIAAVAAALGVVAVAVAVSETDDELRGGLLERTHLIAGSLDPDVLSALSGDPTDAGGPEYLLLKEQLHRVRSSMEGCRFVYVMGIRPAASGDPGGPAGEEVFFFADSESPESGESSPPGQVFPEASDELRESFRTGREFVEGPSRDRWGIWVSALVPLTGDDGSVIAVVGADVDAGDWERTVLAAAAGTVAATLTAIALLTLSILLARSRRWILAQQAALLESEERFREIVEQSSDVFYRQDIATGRFEYVSPRIRTLLGYEPEELLAMSPEQQSAEIHAEDLPACWDSCGTSSRRTRRGGGPSSGSSASGTGPGTTAGSTAATSCSAARTAPPGPCSGACTTSPSGGGWRRSTSGSPSSSSRRGGRRPSDASPAASRTTSTT